MKLSIRHFAAAPLLLVALAISYGLVESLRVEPCVEDRIGWIAGQLIAAAFILYLFAGYRIIVARNYVVIAILTLWAWHLFVLSPFLTATCSEQRSFYQLRRFVGFGFWDFVIVTALVVVASSFVMFLRYRMVNGWPIPNQRRFLQISVAGTTVVLIALAVGAYWLVPILREAYSTFGFGLPAPTRVLLDTYQYWMVLPLACVAVFLYFRMRDQYSEGQLKIALNCAVGLIILVNIVLSTFLFSAFAPVITMCGCV